MRRLRTAILAAMASWLAMAPGAMSPGTSGRAEAADAKPPLLVARGNEPFWRLAIGPDGTEITSPNPELAFRADRVTQTEVDGRTRFAATSGTRRLGVTIDERLCADTMTGLPFPLTVAVALDDEQLTGCGGETIDAIEGGWRVIRLDGKPLPADAVVTIAFGRDGMASGKGGCNRFSGPYMLTGEGLSFGALAATRMACPPPLMQTEERVFASLGTVIGVTSGSNGQLVLMGPEGEAMVLDRVH